LAQTKQSVISNKEKILTCKRENLKSKKVSYKIFFEKLFPEIREKKKGLEKNRGGGEREEMRNMLVIKRE
jgi:hypothetical protein